MSWGLADQQTCWWVLYYVEESIAYGSVNCMQRDRSCMLKICSVDGLGLCNALCDQVRRSSAATRS